MEFHVRFSAGVPDAGDIEAAIQDIDPAAIVDVAASGELRVAAAINADELGELLARAGHPVARAQVVQLPSICCGGCSG